MFIRMCIHTYMNAYLYTSLNPCPLFPPFPCTTPLPRAHNIQLDIECLLKQTLKDISMIHITHMNESCRISEWDTAHTWKSYATHMNVSRRIYEWVMSDIRMSHVTHTNESCHTYELVMSRISYFRNPYKMCSFIQMHQEYRVAFMSEACHASHI